MLRERALSALIFVPVFLGLAWLGGTAFDLFLLIILAIAGFEFSRMLQNSGYKVAYPLMIIAIAALVLPRMFLTAWVEPLAWTLILVLLGAYSLWQYEHGMTKPLSAWGCRFLACSLLASWELMAFRSIKASRMETFGCW
jgi:CDP-diglyceride synthetase